MSDIEQFYPKSQTEWRQWLQENHLSKSSVWLIFYKKKAAQPTISWSKINKAKVEQLIACGKMMEAGHNIILTAKQNGSWSILDDVEELIIPKDLEKAFKRKPGSKDYFTSLSKSVKKMMLQWIALAKQEETRQKRINEIAESASQKLKPKQF
jgi:uncharacterized protein YdeI (YjbR/CyaY-like superfamily)